MGFLDNITKKIQNTVEDKVSDNLSKKAEDIADKAMDPETYKKLKDKKDNEQSSADPSEELSDKKKCPGCGFVTNVRFCGNCGADLTEMPFLTTKELSKLE